MRQSAHDIARNEDGKEQEDLLFTPKPASHQRHWRAAQRDTSGVARYQQPCSWDRDIEVRGDAISGPWENGIGLHEFRPTFTFPNVQRADLSLLLARLWSATSHPPILRCANVPYLMKIGC